MRSVLLILILLGRRARVRSLVKHRIIANQWIYNDDTDMKIHVDHVNRDRSDNHIKNLRWVSCSENQLNRSVNDAIFVDELPDDFIEVDHYGRHEGLVGLYYYDGIFYLDTGVNYRVLNKHQDKKGYYYVYATLLDGLRLKIYYLKFKHEYDLD